MKKRREKNPDFRLGKRRTMSSRRSWWLSMPHMADQIEDSDPCMETKENCDIEVEVDRICGREPTSRSPGYKFAVRLVEKPLGEIDATAGRRNDDQSIFEFPWVAARRKSGFDL